ncbi:hypothetical protein BCR41DRAFT_137751 [Lobosporangium transversale]|uniref:SAP domain-containing protein n=1 Tax=Lobosporangium transversale TaxID=64571 RepID=A0A1Y2GJM5_9FUNG|nr:hypothetical protein BCR41DRAFT_137751 [Lobosporangium transversale]ORZ09355.1 hypothetical protein BCR41DRAFT_137751 [Lobosporangium transversale]|eukprot:XP_021878808.1 hypothetical protein BCR41DRAFT_137751 [Lobosporangium transversale]
MRAMSRIPCQQSTQSIIVSLGAGLCRNTQGSKVIARSRINPIVRTPDRPCFFSTSQRSTARKKKDQDSSVDAAKIDSISKALINDLYTRPSSVKAKVTLEDVMALKPLNPKISVEEFNKLKDRVAASFNVSQLKGVLRSKNMPSGGKKSVLINQIMVLMDLDVLAPEPGPPVVEEPFPNDPTVQREYPSSKQELFFILGTEGDSLRQLEKEKNVRISINIADETYVIRGVPHLIEEAQERIRELVAVTEEQWDVSSYHNRDMVMKEPLALEDIARRSGTYVSSKDDQTLIIAGRSERSMEEAKRLFDIKLNESTCHVESLTFTRQENELNPLGMFPVYDSVTMTADENQKAYFRICQVEPYADKTMDNHTIYPVQSSPSNINTLQELKEHLQSNVNEAQTATQKFELSSHFGQVLFQNKERKMTCLPLSKSFDMLMLEEWLKDAEAPYFFESCSKVTISVTKD